MYENKSPWPGVSAAMLAGFVCGDDALPVLPPPPCADGVCESLGAQNKTSPPQHDAVILIVF